MQIVQKILRALLYVYLVFIFGRAALMKIVEDQTMMEGMQYFGFDRIPSLAIGYAELIVVIALLAGMGKHVIRNIATLLLFFFAFGALIVHWAHRDYVDHYDALFCSIAAVGCLALDRQFRIRV